MNSDNKSLSIAQVLEQIAKLQTALEPEILTFEGPYSYDVKREVEEGFNREPDGAKRNGIYLYTTREEQILYIGKGEYKSGHGIGHRSFAHLGRADVQSKDIIFPYHQWFDDDQVTAYESNLISKGEFLIWTLPIKPDYFSSLVEIHLLSVHQHFIGRLPPLNKKI